MTRATIHTPLRDIILKVCKWHGVTLEQLRGERRTPRLTLARQEAAWTCAEQTACSIAKIARELNRDPTTVSYNIERHQKRLDSAKLKGRAA